MFSQMNFLTKLTIGYAIILIVVGVGSYILADTDEDTTAEDTAAIVEGETEATTDEEESSPSITALIPAFLGIPLLIAGVLTTNPAIGRPAGMASVALVAILALGSLRGVFLLIGAATGGDDITYPMVLQTVLVILSGIYLYLAFKHVRETMMKPATETA